MPEVLLINDTDVAIKYLDTPGTPSPERFNSLGPNDSILLGPWRKTIILDWKYEGEEYYEVIPVGSARWGKTIHLQYNPRTRNFTVEEYEGAAM